MRLTIDVAEHSPKGQPDAGGVLFAVCLRFGNDRDQAFLAKTHAWASRDVLNAFVEQSEVLERRWEGRAAMTSMSPGELELSWLGPSRGANPVADRHYIPFK